MGEQGEIYRSDIPADAVEGVVSPFRKDGHATWFEKRACKLDGEIVGYRQYNQDGSLAMETPMREGRKHGTEYTWEDNGTGPYIMLAEPYENGLVHGTARQWSPSGKLMGTYTMVRGTGFDLWRQVDERGRLYVAEIHSMKEGSPNGFEWWVREDQRSVSHEVHWVEGKRHGIERQWYYAGDIDPDYPEFYINDTVVSKDTYIEKQKIDTYLPEYRVEDDRNERAFPDEILKAMRSA
ncbi:MAG: hypothetical protein IMF05_10090 [Proteobacteria bacterium]|nr:hypothetical protein [Pseudomonadota bacterium]